MSNKLLTLDQAMDTLNNRPGLVYGSLATSSTNTFSLIIEEIASSSEYFKEINAGNISLELDKLRINTPDLAQEFEKSLVEKLIKLEDVNNISQLAKAGWSTCISLTMDMLFESALQNHQDTLPSSKSVTIIDHPSVRPHSRTIPIYKLLGNVNTKDHEHSVVLSESDFLIKKNTWHNILSSCVDYLRGDPLIFFGTEDSPHLVQELLSTLQALPPPSPNSLLFLKDDPILENPTIKSLCNSFSTVRVVDATIREFSKAIQEIDPKQKSLNLTIVEDKENDLREFSTIISVVPSEDISNDIFVQHSRSIIDSLFKPTSIDWNPYQCNLDLRRDCTDKIMKAVINCFDSRQKNEKHSIVINGNAGIGKTTLLKRTAIEISKLGYLTLWCRRAPLDSWFKEYRKLSAEINLIKKSNPKEEIKVVIIVDDPWSSRLDPIELISCFENCEIPIVFIFCLRNTEYYNSQGYAINLPFEVNTEIEVPTKLSTKELIDLSAMLVRIGAVSSQDEADTLIKKLPTKNTDDILCSLWYAIPETRDNLKDSLKDEYHRLGSANTSITGYAHEAQISGESVQHAYEYVCVTSKFQIPLPMEVLVRALKISYEEFIDMSVNGKPLWGLIYEEEDEKNETILFRTRNEIVTKVLLELVNGGVGHAGEFRVLRNLLSSCNSGAIYREFAVDVLVRTKKDLEKYLTYEQGLELYSVAEKALPEDDMLLAHHKGKWIQHVGKDYQKAYLQFEKALNLNQFQGDRQEHPEYIQTSMAATVVSLVKEGKQNPNTGLQLVEDHIQKASNPNIYSGYTGHVSANLLFEMAQQQFEQDSNSVSLKSYSAALQEVEKTLQSIGPNWKNNSKNTESVELLKELQNRILYKIPDDGTLEASAYENFESNGSQLGFELMLRKQFALAQISDKGGSYNKVREKINIVIEYIANQNVKPSIEIYGIRVDLMVRWRLQRPRGEFAWEDFKDDLELILESPKYRENPIKNYYLALSLYHLGQIEKSNAIFANLRRIQAIGMMPKKIRNFYIGPEGFPKRFQCTINRSHGRTYAQIFDLNADIPVLGGNREVVTHTYIGFSMYGTMAVFHKPDENKVLIA